MNAFLRLGSFGSSVLVGSAGVIGGLMLACAAATPTSASGAAASTRWLRLAAADTWRTDRTWHDGLAEKCTYQAQRTIYGTARSFEAIAYTNKENVDTQTSCKSKTAEGVEMFKHHWSERVPTEKYDYDFSTMSYTRAADMAAYKLSAATQEDCGASFKEVWRDGERLFVPVPLG